MYHFNSDSESEHEGSDEEIPVKAGSSRYLNFVTDDFGGAPQAKSGQIERSDSRS